MSTFASRPAGPLGVLVISLAMCLNVVHGASWSDILPPSKFEILFPHRIHTFYTYQSLQQASASFPAFVATGSYVTRKRELAAFLAHVMQESGGLRYTEEIGRPAGYCAPSKSCPCAPGKHYYGRGPLQISWNYNYCMAGKYLKLNLQQNPDLVSTNAVVAWKTALWFWMSQPSGGNNCHAKMTQGTPSFANTIRLINGDVECGGGNSAAVHSRVQYYKTVCALVGVDPGTNLYC